MGLFSRKKEPDVPVQYDDGQIKRMAEIALQKEELELQRLQDELERSKVRIAGKKAKTEVYRERGGHGITFYQRSPESIEASRANGAISSYEDVVLPTSGKKARIPVGPDGLVPEAALMGRFYDMEKGAKRPLGSRDVVQDYDDKADVVLPIGLTPRQAAAWWEAPWKYDIENVDVQGKALTNVGDRTGTLAKVHERIPLHCLPSEEAYVRDMIDRAFPDPKELKKLVDNGELTVVVRPMPTGTAGSYRDMDNTISLDRINGMDNPTIVHEGVHGLRRQDGGRNDQVTRSAIFLDIPLRHDMLPYKAEELRMRSQANIEESLTVAEAFALGQDVSAAYYDKVPVYDEKTKRWRSPDAKEINRMVKEDRKLFTNGTGKPLQGEAATKAVLENYQDSNIARLRSNKSRKMAINDLASIDERFDPVTNAAPPSNRKGNPVNKKNVATAVNDRPVIAGEGAQTTFFSRMFRRK